MNDVIQIAGPRRYKVQFLCSETNVATLLGAIVKEVQSPTVTGDNGVFQFKFVCVQDQLGSLLSLVTDSIHDLHITPFVSDEVTAPRTVRPTLVSVTRIPMVRKRGHGGSAANAMMAVFQTRNTATNADFMEALSKSGYAPTGANSIVSDMVKDGRLIKISRGLYRRPTEQEKALV